MHTFDVLIIGAGPAGVCAALRLLALGYRVAMIENQRFPRAQIGESLSPGIRNIFDYLGAAHLLHQNHCLHHLPAQVAWHEPIATWQPRGHGLMTDRGRLDHDLLNLAVAKGLYLFQPAKYEQAEFDGTHWQVTFREASLARTLSCIFLLDARGRKGIAQSQRVLTAPPMLGMWAYTDARHMPAATSVAAVPEGWLWGSPLHDGRYRVLAFTDPQSVKKQSVHACYRQLLQASDLFRKAFNTTASLSLQTCPVFCYVHEQPWHQNRIQLGEAAFAPDPLSSTGVEKTMRLSLQAVIAIHTVFKKGTAVLAKEFYENKLIASVVNHTRWTAQYYSEAWPGSAYPFWKNRSAIKVPGQAATPFAHRLKAMLHQPAAPALPASQQYHTLQKLQDLWHKKMYLSPAVTYLDTPCVIDDCVQLKTAIQHPNLESEMAFIGHNDIIPLLDMARRCTHFGQLALHWQQLVPGPVAAQMVIMLWEKQILCEA